MNLINQEKKIEMLSILGICFAFLGWSDVVSDFTYKKFNTVENIVFIVSLIGMIHSWICVIANLVVIKISKNNPEKLFKRLLIICSLMVLIVGIASVINNLYIFAASYIIYSIFLEVLSMYHFAFETRAVENERYIPVENKRRTVFKILQCISTVVSNILIINYWDSGFVITTVIASTIFIFTYFNVKNVKCKDVEIKNDESFIQKLNIKKYSKTIKRYAIATILTRFSLSNIMVLFSMHLLQNNIEFSLLKSIKNYAIIFAIIAYFVTKKVNTKNMEIKTTALMEIIIILIIILSVYNPYFLILLSGFYTIDNIIELTGRFKIFEKDTYTENNVEKNAIMDIGIFSAQGLASLILLNIPFNIAITTVIIITIISIILKLKCQREANKI